MHRPSYVPPVDEIDRLRHRIHEAVDECQRRHAKYVSRCAQFDTWSAWARARFEERGSRYWDMTSQADRLVIMSILAERDQALAREAQVRAQVAAEIRSLLATICTDGTCRHLIELAARTAEGGERG